MKLQVIRDVTINSSVGNVYDVISDLSKWNIWSPWMQCEPTAKTEYHGTPKHLGQTQTWSGEVIGSGKMTISGLNLNEQMQMKLEFLTPFKSLADVQLDIKDLGVGKTHITWSMNSAMPFFMIFFRNMLAAYMASDFSRGLNMLKEYVETGSVISKAIFQGEKSMGQFQVIGQKVTIPISKLSTDIHVEFQKMSKRLENGDVAPPEFIVMLSHDHNIPKGTSVLTAGYAYKVGQNIKVPSDMHVVTFPEHKTMLVDFYGPYRNIGNAWSMAMAYQRGKKIKVNKKLPMYELYKTMPGGAEKDIYTQIIVPIK
jgi:hypothetical protein